MVRKYKDKECGICNGLYTPTSPKQKFCVNCKVAAEKKAQAVRDRKRTLKVQKNKQLFLRICPCCEVSFETYYPKKKYCGLSKCEEYRISLKVETRTRKQLIEKGRKYYKNNREKYLLDKARQYRVTKPSAKSYISGTTIKNTYKEVKKYIEDRGYKLLSTEYINNTTKMILQCPEGHDWFTSFHNFSDSSDVQGNRCATCYYENNYTSRFELNVREHILKLYNGNVIYNDRKQIINPDTNRFMELDLYFPELNKAIECDGEYWHSTNEAKIRDEVKTELCKLKGIELFRLSDKDWEEVKHTSILYDFIIN